MNPSKFTVKCVASRHYNILDENGNPLVGEDGVPIRYNSAGAARAEIKASIADAETAALAFAKPVAAPTEPARVDRHLAAVPDAPTPAGRSAVTDDALADAIRAVFLANPDLGGKEVSAAVRATGLRVGGARMSAMRAKVRQELKATV